MATSEDTIQFICDGCGKYKRAMAVCPTAGDAVYCSKKCHNTDYKSHQEMCCAKTEMFQFCNYCHSRVNLDDVCEGAGCEMTYVCPCCVLNDIHTSDCGRICLSFQEGKKLLDNFRTATIQGKDLVTAALDVIEPGQLETLVLQFQLTPGGTIDYTTPTLEISNIYNTKFHKFLILESLREITHVCKYGFQGLESWKCPLVIKVVDTESNQTLFETKRTLLP